MKKISILLLIIIFASIFTTAFADTNSGGTTTTVYKSINNKPSDGPQSDGEFWDGIMSWLKKNPIITVDGHSIYEQYAKNVGIPQDKYQKMVDDMVDAETSNPLFERIVASALGHILITVLKIFRDAIGTNDLSKVIFNNGILPSDPISSLSDAVHADNLSRTMNDWYVKMAIIYSSLILISVVVFGIKYIISGVNPYSRYNAHKMLLRIVASMLIVIFTPILFVVLLYINNLLVHLIAIFITIDKVKQANSSLDFFTIVGTLKTGSALADVAVLGMFAYVEIRINIMFLLRVFNLIVFFIFTPIACFMWTIDDKVEAFAVWIGEMLSNIFMQFFYALTFAVYLSFVGVVSSDGSGWSIYLVWAMMLIPIAESLRESLQGYVARISGVPELRVTDTAIKSGYGLFKKAGQSIISIGKVIAMLFA